MLVVAALLLRPRASALWALLLLVPILSIYLVSFTPQVGWARYFVVASPAWLALTAIGLDGLLSGGCVVPVGTPAAARRPS